MPEGSEKNDAENLSRRGVAWPALVMFFVAVVSLVYAVRERGQVRELAASKEATNAALGQARGEIQALSAKLDELRAAAVRPAPTTPAAELRAVHRVAAVKKTAPRPSEEARWKKLRSQLSEQGKQLASTREELQETRQDLQGRLSSTRDELSTSIARNHDELVAFQKRGERNYYEFQLAKSKQFQRVGPISLSLRKANTKRKSYDLAMIVDDMQLQKKSVNLYEPVLINLSDRPQPVELVINRISKDSVAGYVSEPKYRKSELAAAATGENKAQPSERQPLQPLKQ